MSSDNAFLPTIEKTFFIFFAKQTHKTIKNKIGDFVGMSDTKSVFSEGDATNWICERYNISKKIGDTARFNKFSQADPDL